MPDREFIHSISDISAVLHYALGSGMQVMFDGPQPEPRPRFLAQEDVALRESGVFLLFKPEWVYGEFQISPVLQGHNAGRFFVQPRANFAPITVYFSGERVVDGRRKLGSGTLSFHRDWLEMPAKVMHPTPAEVEMWFKRVFAQVTSGAQVRVGVHRYHICRGVIDDPRAGECLPPFDYIPWNEGVVAELRRSQIKRRRKPSAD